MGPAIRASFIAVAGLVGGALGAAILCYAYAVLTIDFVALGFAERDTHTGRTMLVLLGMVFSVGLGGVLGVRAGVQFAKHLLRE